MPLFSKTFLRDQKSSRVQICRAIIEISNSILRIIVPNMKLSLLISATAATMTFAGVLRGVSNEIPITSLEIRGHCICQEGNPACNTGHTCCGDSNSPPCCPVISCAVSTLLTLVLQTIWCHC